MRLSIPDKVSWRKMITSDTVNQYNKNGAKRIIKTSTNCARDNITYTISPLTQEHLEWFIPLYTDKLATMSNPAHSDIYTKTLATNKKDFFILVILENTQKVGGAIFNQTETDINIAYKIFENNWSASTLPASPSLYADYLLTEYGRGIQKQLISHGKDRNGYGKTSNIGLAIFKISLGYKPYLPKKYTIETLDTESINCDSLYFAVKENSTELQGYLFTTKDTMSNWIRLSSYQDNVAIEWILR